MHIVAGRRPTRAFYILNVLIAIALIGVFYAHAIYGDSRFTPTLIAAALALFAIQGFAGAISAQLRVQPGSREASVLMLFGAFILSLCSTVSGASHEPYTAQDIGVGLIQIGLPFVILFFSGRIILLRIMLSVALAFALADFAANLSTALGFTTISERIGSGTSYGTHWLGLPGNTFAEGAVAFLGVTDLSFEIGRGRRLSVLLRIPLLIALFVSLWMIRARTEIAASVVIAPTLIFRRYLHTPSLALLALMAGGLLVATFIANPYGTDESSRALLIERGVNSAAHHTILGNGPRYLDTSVLASGNFDALSKAGVTESGALDLAIAYGIPSLVLLSGSVIFALGARRSRPTLPSILLSVITGELTISGVLISPVMAAVFFICLVTCQQDELDLIASGGGLV